MNISNVIDWQTLRNAMGTFVNWFATNVTNFYTFEDKNKQPSEWIRLSNLIQEMNSIVGQKNQHVTIPAQLYPLLKRILIVYRRAESDRIQQLQGQTHHIEVLSAFDKELESVRRLFAETWFRETKAIEVPRLTDFWPIQKIEAAMADRFRASERKYDEKFHILQAPELFLIDLNFYRHWTDLRGTCTTVAFLDIDNFKKMNSDYTETIVDRNMLPRFMQAIEAHVHFHGHAYRQGGDEYLIILPGLSQQFAIDFLDDLRTTIETVTYPSMSDSVTVSMGVCSADPDCFLTDREIQEKANIAKENAKAEGKNRIATYHGSQFRMEDLQIIRPVNATTTPPKT